MLYLLGSAHQKLNLEIYQVLLLCEEITFKNSNKGNASKDRLGYSETKSTDFLSNNKEIFLPTSYIVSGR